MTSRTHPSRRWRRWLTIWLLLAVCWQPVLLALSQAHGFETDVVAGTAAAGLGADGTHAGAASDHSHDHDDGQSGWHVFLHLVHCCAPGAALLQQVDWPVQSPPGADLPLTGDAPLLSGSPAELLRPPIV